MPRVLSYSDAVRLLGGEGPTVRALDRLTGGLLLGAGVAFPAVLGWLDARAEFVRLCHRLVRDVAERRGGLGRFDRTERLVAAHTVIVVTSFFEAMSEAPLSIRFADLELSRAEQLAIAGDGAAGGSGGFVTSVLAAGVVLPEPHIGDDAFQARLATYYAGLHEQVGRFVAGLSVWDDLDDTARARFTTGLRDVPAAAVARYQQLLRSLATEFPEFGFWTATREHQGTRDAVRALRPSLTHLEQLLTSVASGRATPAQVTALPRAYRAALDRPIVESGEVTTGMSVPTLEQAYLTPRFRVSNADPDVPPNSERWWSKQPVHHNLDEFLAGYLTSVRAVQAPILVLGQPGAGKSVFTRILAARLPADFLPVRVVLRDVPADADVQDQLEHALRAATGEQLSWPALVRAADGALPVVLLDGFDELIQATGVRYVDYLTRVAAFQQREADQGRPVAVLVTTRTSVADRSRAPADTLLLRIEPFDNHQIHIWLQIWNRANRAHFLAAGVAPLSTQTVLAYPELAAQPLLLLMLCLYDADANALQRNVARLSRHHLYERLLHSFALREVAKHRPHLDAQSTAREVEEQLRRLALVAFAMFNRGAQWIGQHELERDLTSIFGEHRQVEPDLRSRAGSAELVLGRFFFIHRAQASRDDTQISTYEFLHATFGEYLVARLTVQALLETATRDASSTLPSAAIDDDLLHALLSFAALAGRSPIVEFLTAGLSDLPEHQSDQLNELLVRLHAAAGHPRARHGFSAYQPTTATVSARHAAYSANLVLLATIVAGSLNVQRFLAIDGDDHVDHWHNLTLFWHSQLNHAEYTSIIYTYALERGWNGAERALTLTIHNGQRRRLSIDPFWIHKVPPNSKPNRIYDEAPSEAIAIRGHLQAGLQDDVVLHAVEPLVTALGASVLTRFYALEHFNGAAPSAARALIDVLLLPTAACDSHVRRTAYLRCATIATVTGLRTHDDDSPDRYIAVLVTSLTADPAASAELAADVLEILVETFRPVTMRSALAPTIVRCIIHFLARRPVQPQTRQRLATIAEPMLDDHGVEESDLRVLRRSIIDDATLQDEQ
ncbi:NACHT domain-containing protein [Dactylosporangium sp. NPDC051541]|uniref:NACHT domain-containing protein n=1 Tax=Dactylosporangium sp. NPDC051541 TaxID=3363977 RepID=UPI00379F1E54